MDEDDSLQEAQPLPSRGLNIKSRPVIISVLVVFLVAIVVTSVVVAVQVSSKRTPPTPTPPPSPSPSPNSPQTPDGEVPQECLFAAKSEEDNEIDIGSLLIKRAYILEFNQLLDIYLVKGKIVEVGANIQPNGTYKVLDVEGSPVTAGLVDMHSHAGVYAWPDSFGNDDGNEGTNPTLPMVRAIDAFNPNDLAIPIMVSGGITTAQVLPGSANIMGGQGVIMKLFPTDSVEKMRVKNAPTVLKMACGENPKKVYGNYRNGEMPSTRMGSAWLMRKRFEEARNLMLLQNKFCANQTYLTGFPHSPIELDNLVQMMRHRVILNVHCYKVEDMEMMIRLSKEFDFSVTTFHHALEAWKIPDTLREYGANVAIFSDLWGYKMEALDGSVWAPAILRSGGVQVALKSDHPVINAKELIVEAQIAHHFGMTDFDALYAVTLVPAKAIGMQGRVGSIRTGHDADIVVWDKHPLQMGAKPLRVLINGQLAYADNNTPIQPFTDRPKPPRVIMPRATASPSDMISTLIPRPLVKLDIVNLASNHIVSDYAVVNAFKVYTMDPAQGMTLMGGLLGNLIVRVTNGIISCVGSSSQCDLPKDFQTIDIMGGVIAPGLINVNELGVQEIAQESTSNDGGIAGSTAELAGIVAANGIIYNSKHHYAAAAGGVLTSVTNPKSSQVVAGQSTAYFTMGANSLRSEQDQVLISSRTALNLKIGQSFKQSDISKSISGQIARIRSLFLAAQQKFKASDTPYNASMNMEYFNGGDFSDEIVPEDDPFLRVLKGEIPVVFWAHQADQIGSILQLIRTFKIPKPIIAGGSEIHLVGEQVRELNVSVIFTPITCQPENFERLHCDNSRNIPDIFKWNEDKLGLAISDPDLVRRLRWETGIAKVTHGLSDEQALKAITSNIADMFGLPYGVGRIVPGTKANFVAYTADPLSYEGHVEMLAVNNKVYFHPRQL